MDEISKLVQDLIPLMASVLLLALISGFQWAQKKLKDRNSPKVETDGLVHSLAVDERITEYVTELRVKLGADRAYFSQPHNGTHFASMFPMYKLSRTHESCAMGVPYLRKEMQNIPVSEITELIAPILLGTETPGVKLICPAPTPAGRVVCVDTNNMGHTYERYFLESMSVCTHLKAAVWVDGDLYGFVGVDFGEQADGDCALPGDLDWQCKASLFTRVAAERIGHAIRESRKKIKVK